MPQLVVRRPRVGAEQAAARRRPTLPVFAGIPGGMGQLPEALAAGLDVRIGATVRELVRTDAGFALTVGPTTVARADRGATRSCSRPRRRRPPGCSASVAPAAAAELGRDRVRVDGGGDLRLRRVVGARSSRPPTPPASWSRRWTAPDQGLDVLVRQVGLGARGRRRACSCCAPRWAGTARRPPSRPPTRSWSPGRSPTCATRSASRAAPVDTHVQRWGGGLPQYAVGHLDRVARIRAAVAAVPGLAVCGAAYDGVGIPAVIASAHRAAARIVETRETAPGRPNRAVSRVSTRDQTTGVPSTAVRSAYAAASWAT